MRERRGEALSLSKEDGNYDVIRMVKVMLVLGWLLASGRFQKRCIVIDSGGLSENHSDKIGIPKCRQLI